MTRGRLRSVLLPSASACVVALALVGCGPSPKPAPPRTPDPIPTPLYSSDEEALAAAKDSFARYVDVSNRIGKGGWTNLTSLGEVATGDALKSERDAAEENRSQGYRSEGDAVGTIVKIEVVRERSVMAYACIDVSNTRLIDAAGADRTPADRADINAFEVTFAPKNGSLLVSRGERWSGDSFC